MLKTSVDVSVIIDVDVYDAIVYDDINVDEEAMLRQFLASTLFKTFKAVVKKGKNSITFELIEKEVE